MRKFLFDLLIDGQPVLVPDGDITISFEDLDSEESGRDEAGFMHRVVLRSGVKKIPLSYASLDTEEYRYMESLFGGKREFRVDCRGLDGSPLSFMAYRSKHSISIHNIKTGIHKNYNFDIIEC